MTVESSQVCNATTLDADRAPLSIQIMLRLNLIRCPSESILPDAPRTAAQEIVIHPLPSSDAATFAHRQSDARVALTCNLSAPATKHATCAIVNRQAPLRAGLTMVAFMN